MVYRLLNFKLYFLQSELVIYKNKKNKKKKNWTNKFSNVNSYKLSVWIFQSFVTKLNHSLNVLFVFHLFLNCSACNFWVVSMFHFLNKQLINIALLCCIFLYIFTIWIVIWFITYLSKHLFSIKICLDYVFNNNFIFNFDFFLFYIVC